MLTEAMKQDALQFLRQAAQGRLTLRFSERFDEKSRIWNFKEHAHPYLELIYFKAGRAQVAACGDTLDVSLYDLLAYPPGVAHCETLDASIHQEIVCLWLELGNQATLPFSFKLCDDSGELGWLCQAAYDNRLRRSGHYLELEEHLLKSLVLLMEQKLGAVSQSGSAALDRSRIYIDEHYAEDFSVETLAGVACVTPSYLSRLYRKHLGSSPMRYRNAVRVEKAKHLLLVDSASVEEIADLLGFRDTKYFSRLFKSLTSFSPTSFRRRYRAS